MVIVAPFNAQLQIIVLVEQLLNDSAFMNRGSTRPNITFVSPHFKTPPIEIDFRYIKTRQIEVSYNSLLAYAKYRTAHKAKTRTCSKPTWHP